MHLRYSDPLVSFLCDGFHCVHGKGREAYEELKELELLPGITGRDFLIAAGDAIRKVLDKAFYSKILMKRLERTAPDATVVIDDLRKLPELEALVKGANCDEFKVLLVNVQKPEGGVNDCEFEVRDLHRAATINFGVRVMDVTWDDKGCFQAVRNDG